jgi:hypothetical protein
LESKGEKLISEYLKTNNYYYDSQYKFSDCKNMNVLKFDFAIFLDIKKTKLLKLIEYDGELHFKPQHSTRGRYKKLMEMKINDKIKNEYCENNKIELLRIPYWQFDEIEQILIKELNLSRKEA